MHHWLSVIHRGHDSQGFCHLHKSGDICPAILVWYQSLSFSSKRQSYSHSPPASWTESLQQTDFYSLTSFPSASEAVLAVEGERQRDRETETKTAKHLVPKGKPFQPGHIRATWKEKVGHQQDQKIPESNTEEPRSLEESKIPSRMPHREEGRALWLTKIPILDNKIGKKC